jgi:Fe-S cluster assembly ATP-binding protein
MKLRDTLVIDHLAASIETKEILNDISLIVKSGEVHVIMGPNGSGKSTFASALMGHPAYTLLLTEKIF